MLYIPLFFEQNMWDRTETLTPQTSIKVITPIGEICTPLSVDEICRLRADEIAKISKDQNKKIHVFWSGGLDSTTVFLSLREVVDKDRLVVMYNKASLEEYPGFFESNIQGVYETYELSMSSLWTAVEYACTNGIAVTGEIADQIFGSVMFMGRSPEELQQPWQSFDNKLCSDVRIQNFVDACPSKISNMAQFLWWFNYAAKYQNVQVRMLVDNTVSKLNDNIYHFFDNKYFNDYAVSTAIEEKIPGFEMKNYKKPLRDVIYKLSNDYEYAYTKPKVRSLVPIYGKVSAKKVAKAINLQWERSY